MDPTQDPWSLLTPIQAASVRATAAIVEKDPEVLVRELLTLLAPDDE